MNEHGADNLPGSLEPYRSRLAVSLKVFDLLGNEMTSFVNGFMKAGTYNAEIDASNWASGVYFYKLTTPEFNATKKMILVK